MPDEASRSTAALVFDEHLLRRAARVSLEGSLSRLDDLFVLRLESLMRRTIA
jgi:hypothetical protein